jgi:hypothetical protein
MRLKKMLLCLMLTFAVIFSQLAGVATAASVSADKEGISWRSIEGYARKNSDWLKSDWVGRFILEGKMANK